MKSRRAKMGPKVISALPGDLCLGLSLPKCEMNLDSFPRLLMSYRELRDGSLLGMLWRLSRLASEGEEKAGRAK